MKQTFKRLAAALPAACLVLTAPLAAETPSSMPSAAPAPKSAPPAAAVAAEHIEVQHILIGFKGSVPGKNITRTQEEAKTLAAEILARARKGEDFLALVKQYTDDSAPGIYRMANTDVPIAPGESPRGGMVKGFGDAGFSLKVGEIGMAAYDPQASPFGWHIVKRLK